MTDFCQTCGQFKDDETTEKLWDTYHRCPDPSHDSEPLVFFPSDDQEREYDYDEDDYRARMLAMEKNMSERGLCVTCGRPELSRLDLDRYPLMDDEEMQAHADMAAEMAAERRAGC